MHPTLLGELARDHVRSLAEEADHYRLAHLSPEARPGLRHRVGVRLISMGNRMTCETADLAGAHGGRF